MKKILLFILFLAPLALTGCVVGQYIPIDHKPVEAQAERNRGNVSVVVEDKRNLVLKDGRPDSVIGFYRGGFGNAFEVTTRGNESLKNQIKKDIFEELDNLGFTVSESGKQLTIDINQWHFNGYQNAELWCDIKVSVSDNGSVIATDTLKNKVTIQGTAMRGAKGGLERDIPGLYDKLIGDLLRNNDVILAALK